MRFQLTKVNAPLKPPNRCITLDRGEEAMEEGLLDCTDSEVDASHFKVAAKTKDICTAVESTRDDDTERGCSGKAVEIPDDVRGAEMRM
jgi:hypothetical protein